jgi:hypothetical protein
MENQELAVQEKPQQHLQTAVEQSRATQEIQGMIISAKKFPRDELASFNKILKSCQRISLAEQAIYYLPVGGKNHEGPSIRLAEVLAQAWGNTSFGIKELNRGQGRSLCAAFCIDWEANTRSEFEFEVDHWIEVGKKGEIKTKKHITDPIEIDRLIANRGARKLRNAILNIIPPDIIEEAVKMCKATVAKGGGEPIVDRVRKMIMAFDSIGVSKEMLAEYLKHDLDICTGEEIAGLQAIYKSIFDKQAKRQDFFNVADESQEKKKSKLSEKIKENAEAVNENPA